MPRKSQDSFFNLILISRMMTMPEGSDIDKNIYKVEKHKSEKTFLRGSRAMRKASAARSARAGRRPWTAARRGLMCVPACIHAKTRIWIESGGIRAGRNGAGDIALNDHVYSIFIISFQ